MMEIIIGGDICSAGMIENKFIKGNSDEIFNDLLMDIKEADLSIANLECPLVNSQTPINKPGTILSADKRCIKGLFNAGWKVLNFANNHSFDHGKKGLIDTIQTVENAGMHLLGAGRNIQEASKPFIKEIKKEKVIIYSMAEREFSIADSDSPGANPFDLINIINTIKTYGSDGYFIVLIHGGKEFYDYPTPEMVRKCRFIIDMGADAVICCHTHCPLPWEIYKGKPVVYGMGNLIFEPMKELPTSWYEGYMVKLSLDAKTVNFDVIPYTQFQGNIGAKKMGENEKESFISKMNQRVDVIQNENLLGKKWHEYCKIQKNNYIGMLLGYNKYFRKITRMFSRPLHSRKTILRSLLLTQTETH